MTSDTSGIRGPLFTALVTILAVLLIGSMPVLSQDDKNAKMIGDEACLDCHDEVAAAFRTNVHLQNAETPGFVCESCHGPGALHEAEGDQETMYNPATEYSSVAENRCLDCHNGGQFQAVSGNAHHEVADGCSDCHAVHGNAENLLKRQGQALCLDCHSAIAAQLRLPSHHPVLEGMMDCQSCHNPHGDINQFAVTGENRELCLSCHPQHEGPFVYEHDPVNEDCGICHNAHGAVANNLLVQNEPALCLNCHSMHFHTSITGYDGEFTPPLNPERGAFTSSLDSWKAAMTTNCTQCHSQVHGSDLPSQGITSQGGSLTR